MDDTFISVKMSKIRMAFSTTLLLLGVVLFFGGLGLEVHWHLGPSVPVRRAFNNYIAAAGEMYDPYEVLSNMDAALQGIEDLGLTPTDNGAVWPWDRNYRHTPEYTIDQIHSIQQFAFNFIEWKEQSYTNGTVIEVAADVYTEKLGHLRSIADEPDTSIIRVAYCNKTPGLRWYAASMLIALYGCVVLMVAILLRLEV